MSETPYSRQELDELLKKHEVNGKLTAESISEIVYDPRFPEELFPGGNEKLIEMRNDAERYKQLAGQLLAKHEKLIELQNEITIIVNEIAPLENEFNEIKTRIQNRMTD